MTFRALEPNQYLPHLSHLITPHLTCFRANTVPYMRADATSHAFERSAPIDTLCCVIMRTLGPPIIFGTTLLREELELSNIELLNFFCTHDLLSNLIVNGRNVNPSSPRTLSS